MSTRIAKRTVDSYRTSKLSGLTRVLHKQSLSTSVKHSTCACSTVGQSGVSISKSVTRIHQCAIPIRPENY